MQKLLEMFDSGMLSNPFTKLSGGHEIMPLINFATEAVKQRSAVERLMNAIGTASSKSAKFRGITPRMYIDDLL